jgi:hypothetical protein
MVWVNSQLDQELCARLSVISSDYTSKRFLKVSA